MDVSDAFDEISNWEEQLLIEGEELGMERGRELGVEEGRELGCACCRMSCAVCNCPSLQLTMRIMCALSICL